MVGPAALAGLARARGPAFGALVLGAVGAVLLADVCGMSKAEVERIWMPFVPWVVLASATARRHDATVRTRGLARRAGAGDARGGGGGTVAVVTDAAPYVLVVEDDPTISEVVVRYLAREGLEVTAVADGQGRARRRRRPVGPISSCWI